jgi:hypothetical protein
MSNSRAGAFISLAGQHLVTEDFVTSLAFRNTCPSHGPIAHIPQIALKRNFGNYEAPIPSGLVQLSASQPGLVSTRIFRRIATRQ